MARHLLGDEGNLTTTYNIVNRGVEVSTWVNVSRNLTGMLNFSYTSSNRSEIFPEFEGWFGRESAFWNRTPGVEDLINGTSGSRVEEEVAAIEEAAHGIREYYGFSYGERSYKANASGRYSFTEGRLKGLFVGGGIRWQGKSRLGREVTGTAANGRRTYGDILYGPEDFKADAFVGYRRELSVRGRSPELTVQVNVTNLTNEDEWMPLRYNANKSGLTRVLLFEPRKARLSATVTF